MADMFKVIYGMILVLIIFLAGFSLAYLINISYPPEEVSIPDSDMVQDFCKSKGFDSGWLSSSSCSINEVMCHKKIGNLVENKCIKWEAKD